jgi:hypothetical protein
MGRRVAVSAGTATTETIEQRQEQRANDKRRITEHDADYRRLHAQVERALWAGIHAYVQALRACKPSDQESSASVFIAHQVKALQMGYLAGHWEGERDYWHAVSARHSAQAHTRMSQVHGVGPEVMRMRRALMFYGAASVTKQAREGLAAWHADQRAHPATLDESIRLDTKANAAMNAWLDGLTARVSLSADIAWTGLQDGYLAAGTVDPANPYAYVWWQLEPTVKQHCNDCPYLAAGSPYTAPGSGGNELTQTPGDGGTECGAGCKCTLEYGSSQEVGAASDFAPDWAKSPQADTAAMTPTPPAPPEQQPAAQDDWEARRQAAIAAALQPSQRSDGSGDTSDWEQRRQEAIAKAEAALRGQGGSGGVWPERDEAIARAEAAARGQGSAAWPERDEAIAQATNGQDPWQAIREGMRPVGMPPAVVEAGAAGVSGQVDTTRVEVGGVTSITRDFTRVTSGPEPASPARASALTDGQKQALDQIRGIALLWDAVRGTLPDFATYFNAASRQNLWQNRELAGLDAAQRELVARYLRAQADFAANAPHDDK